MNQIRKRKLDCILDQAAQLLNLKDNEDDNYDKTTYLYDTFSQVLKESINPEFVTSLKNSQNCHLKNDSLILKNLLDLKIEDPNSFLITPLASSSHYFSVLVRNTKEGFSSTIINRGVRANASAYMEYLFNDPEKLYKVLSENHYYSYDKSIKDIYKSFKQASYNTYRLSVFSGSQKKGNCVVKEPESAIKYAYVTQNYNFDQLKNLRKKGIEFRPKWQPSTMEIHRKYITILLQNHAEIKDKLDDLWQEYAKKKTKIRRLVRITASDGVTISRQKNENYSLFASNEPINDNKISTESIIRIDDRNKRKRDFDSLNTAPNSLKKHKFEI